MPTSAAIGTAGMTIRAGGTGRSGTILVPGRLVRLIGLVRRTPPVDTLGGIRSDRTVCGIVRRRSRPGTRGRTVGVGAGGGWSTRRLCVGTVALCPRAGLTGAVDGPIVPVRCGGAPGRGASAPEEERLEARPHFQGVAIVALSGRDPGADRKPIDRPGRGPDTAMMLARRSECRARRRDRDPAEDGGEGQGRQESARRALQDADQAAMELAHEEECDARGADAVAPEGANRGL